MTTEAPSISSEPAYGREGLEIKNGYVPLPDEPKEEAPAAELTTKEAAEERLKQLSGSEGSVRTFTSGLPDNVSLTAEQAGKMLADARTAEREADDADGVELEQNRIDKLRGDDKPAEPKIETDDDVERVLKSPKVQAAISSKLEEAEKQRSNYESAVAEIGKARIAALLGDAPELTSLPLEKWAETINAMALREPERARQVVTRLRAFAEVEAAAQHIKTDKTAKEQADMKEYTARERARYVDLIKDVPAKEQAAIEAHLPKMLKEYGVDTKQFLSAIANQTHFPRSVAQALLVKAARYDLMKQAAKAAPTRAVPSVQKPGMAGPRGAERQDASLAALSAKLGKTGSLKDAAALLSARRSKGR